MWHSNDNRTLRRHSLPKKHRTISSERSHFDAWVSLLPEPVAVFMKRLSQRQAYQFDWAGEFARRVISYGQRDRSDRSGCSHGLQNIHRLIADPEYQDNQRIDDVLLSTTTFVGRREPKTVVLKWGNAASSCYDCQQLDTQRNLHHASPKRLVIDQFVRFVQFRFVYRWG